jgi:hypothetical protein
VRRRIRTWGAAAVLAFALLHPGGHAHAGQAPAGWPLDAVPVGTVARQAGDLDALVRALGELMPQRGSGLYRDPTAAEARRLRTGVAAANRGELAGAARTLAPLGFRVVRFRDAGTGRPLVVLAQGREDWARKRAWDVYVLDRGGAERLVEAPHIRADQHTERVAVTVFRRSRARALLVAGAHRFALPTAEGARWAPADVAHQRGSAFHAVHRALRARGLTTVVQAHGFESGRPDAALDAIVSSGTATPSTRAGRVHARLVEAGVHSCLYRSPACRVLGATLNVQGRDTPAAGGDFVHVELARPVRVDPAARATAARAIAAGLRP